MVGDGGHFSGSEVASFPPVHVTAHQHPCTRRKRRGGGMRGCVGMRGGRYERVCWYERVGRYERG